jgi:Tfp pilus assembly protein PilV
VTVRPARRRSGLSLLEVLLALAIFMIALAAIGTLIDSGTTHAVDAASTVTAGRLAHCRMADFEAGLLAVADGGSGVCDEDTTWSWEATTAPMAVPNTYEVTVRVYRPTNPRVEVKLSQVVFDPAYLNTAAPSQPPETTTTTGG